MMEFLDLPLILTLGVIISGAIWAFDHIFLRPQRLRHAAEIVAQDADLGEDLRQAALRVPSVVEYAHSFFPVLAVVLVLRSFVIEPYQIPSGSMIPTLDVGDFILVNKYAYGLRLPVLGTKVVDIGDPQRGDVMVFVPPHTSRYFIKRVIGLPGDVVGYRDKRLTINGKPVLTTLVAEPPGLGYQLLNEQLGEVSHPIHLMPRRRSLSGPAQWTVPAGHYFMMGDNRDDSRDSRAWGAASGQQIVGKAFAVWAHKDPGWNLPTFSRNRLINSQGNADTGAGR